MRGKRAVEWRFVDEVVPDQPVQGGRGRRARRRWPRRPIGRRPGRASRSGPLDPAIDGDTHPLQLRHRRRSTAPSGTCELTIAAPGTPQPATPDEFLAAGDQAWALRAFRELDDALLRLRLNEPEIGTVLLRATGDPGAVLAVDAALAAHQDHWLVREIIGQIRRTLKRVDLTARTFFALIEPGNAFAGTLFELALAADRAYMLDDRRRGRTRFSCRR